VSNQDEKSALAVAEERSSVPTLDTRVCRTMMVAQPALGVVATSSTYPQDWRSTLLTSFSGCGRAEP
jgi:hypothetical protein